ncbi:MAG TPA: LysR substrate-binding domain-containing protein [Terriglobales bacterium]|nr:LysR substrate-binding domain-containing protein [Terriglobales bacterium]
MNIDIDLRHLRYFVAVAEELHFGRAALRLHIAQPPLSQQIKQLESNLGHPLFVRTSRAVSLTAAGKELLERARRILTRMDEDLAAVRRVGRGEVGALTIAFTGSAILSDPLPEAIRTYRRRYPEVDLRLREMGTMLQIDALRDGSIDLGFLRDPGPFDGLVIEELLREPYVAVLPSRHPLAKSKVVAVAKLRGEPFIFHRRNIGPLAYDRTMAVCEHAGFLPEIVQEAPQWPTAIRLVESGLGVTIAPKCVSKLETMGVVFRPIDAKRAFTEVSLGHRNEPLMPTATEFVRMAKEAFAK